MPDVSDRIGGYTEWIATQEDVQNVPPDEPKIRLSRAV
jgi:hypothetical protein